MKILIIKPSALGDIVHSLPFLDTLKRCHPEAEIHWVVAGGFHELLEDHPMISRLWVIEKDQWKKLSRIRETALSLKNLFRGLRKEKYDLAIDLQGLFRSAVISFATGAARRIGFLEGREGSPLFYTHTVKGGKELHAIERYLKIAAFLGCGADSNELHYPFSPLPANSPVLRSLPVKYAVIAPSAGKEANRWPAGRFGELAARLPVKSVVIASRADETIARAVVSASNGKAISLAGKTNLRDLIAVIGRAKFFISNDTGPMHIAAALRVPVFAVFGPANPVRTGPYGEIHTVIRADLPCSPCYRKRKCRSWECMETITVDKVFQAIQEKQAFTTGIAEFRQG